MLKRIVTLIWLLTLGQFAVVTSALAASPQERNRERAIAFLEGIKPDANLEKHVNKYVAADLKQHDGAIADGRDAYREALAADLAKGASWTVKHSLVEDDLVVLVGANTIAIPMGAMGPMGGGPGAGGPPPGMGGSGGPPPGMSGPPAGMTGGGPPPGGMPGMPGMGGKPVGSPEMDKPGSAFIITYRFNKKGQIVEAWKFEQAFNAPWARAGSINPNSMF